MRDHGTDNDESEPAPRPEETARRVTVLPPAEPGESLRPYVRRIALILAEWLDGTRRWRRRAEWEVIRAAVEAAYGERVEARTLETYLAAARKGAAAPSPQVMQEPTPTPAPPPLPSVRTNKRNRSDAGRARADAFKAFIGPRP